MNNAKYTKLPEFLFKKSHIYFRSLTKKKSYLYVKNIINKLLTPYNTLFTIFTVLLCNGILEENQIKTNDNITSLSYSILPNNLGLSSPVGNFVSKNNNLNK